MSKPIRKAVIAAAGFGTRFLPQTKAMPKEMLPLVDKPIIQYIVEELVGAGIEDIIIVTGYSKRPIEDHFDALSAELGANLRQGGKQNLLDEVKKISDLANFVYVRQKGPYGNATPLINVSHLIGDEPFVYAFADDFVVAEPSRFQQIIAVHNQHGGSVLTCVRAKQEEDYERYGFVDGEPAADGLVLVKKVVEKPGSKEASPSDLASVSGYVLRPEIFSYLRQDLEGLPEGIEFAMQPSLERMSLDGHKVYAHEVTDGTFYDTGNKIEYVKAVVDFAMQNEDIREPLLTHIKKIISQE